MMYKRTNAYKVYMISQKYFQIYPAVHVHLKTDKVDKKKATVKKYFLHFFSISSSSRHEKRCRMFKRIYCRFQCSRNYLCYQQTLTFSQSFCQREQILASWFDYTVDHCFHCDSHFCILSGEKSWTFSKQCSNITNLLIL